MPLITKTVAEYLAGAPFPAGTIAIVDTAEAISGLNPVQIAALAGNGVVSLDATVSDDTHRVSLSLAQFDALGSVTLSAGDVVELAASEAAIHGLDQARLDAIAAKGVDLINANGGSLQISRSFAMAIAQTSLAFHGGDLVTIRDDLSILDLSADEITRLSSKGVDVFDSTTNAVDAAFSIEKATAFAQSTIVFKDDDQVTMGLSALTMSRLSAAQLASLAAKGIDRIDVSDPQFTLSLDQYGAITDPLHAMALTASDHVILAVGLAELASLKDSQIAAFAANHVDDVALSTAGQVLTSLGAPAFLALAERGVTAIDASDDVLGLTLSQYNALSTVGGMKLTLQDTVTLSASAAEIAALDEAQMADMRTKGIDVVALRDAGQVLGALRADQISALATKGVDVFDAADDRLTLTAAQYAALNVIRLSAADAVTITASADYVLPAEVDHLALTDAALRGTGNGLSNSLTGNTKGNTLSGLNGNDTLAGGLGNDTLSGGRNKDVFVFDTRPSRSANCDTIKDFSVADDTIWLSHEVFTKLGTGSLTSPRKLSSQAFAVGSKATHAADRILYDKATGQLSYDADGAGKGAAIVFAKLSAGLKLTAADFYVI